MNDKTDILPEQITICVRKSGELSLNIPLTEAILGATKYIRADLVAKDRVCGNCDRYFKCTVQDQLKDKDNGYCSEFSCEELSL